MGQEAGSDGDDDSLKPGQFVWTPQLSPDGPMTVIVSLADQRAYIYRNGVRIGVSTISSGRPGYETPTGIFTILEKSVKHRSNRYSNAPMPYMERLTWDGIALHAGKLPGYAASHGCVRLPLAFSKALFQETSVGTTVFVTDGQPDLQAVLDSGLADSFDPSATPATDPAPTNFNQTPTAASPDASQTANNSEPTPVTIVQASTDPGPANGQDPTSSREEFGWHPEIAPAGPVTILISYADQRMVVLRNGTVIGRSRVEIPSHVFNGTAALQLEGFDTGGKANWLYIGKAKHAASAGTAPGRSLGAQVHVPQDFLAEVRSILAPGVTMVVSDESFAAGNAGRPTTVFAN